jgi:hypothetical protein
VEPQYYRDLVAPLIAGKKFILTSGPVAGLVIWAKQLRELGAPPPLLLGMGVGMGDMPEEGEAVWHALEVSAENFVETLAVYESLLRDPPADARAAIEAYDPAGEATALGQILLSPVRDVAGRPMFGARRPEWVALEDKTVVDEFWDFIGIHRAASAIVPAHLSDLRAAAARLDRGLGTAWAADARSGVHGGAIYLRWIRTSEDADEAAKLFERRLPAHGDDLLSPAGEKHAPLRRRGVLLGSAGRRPR